MTNINTTTAYFKKIFVFGGRAGSSAKILVRCGKLCIEFTVFLRGDADNVWLIPIACAKGLRRLRDRAFVVVAPDFDFNLGAGCNGQRHLVLKITFFDGKAILGNANQTGGDWRLWRYNNGLDGSNVDVLWILTGCGNQQIKICLRIVVAIERRNGDGFVDGLPTVRFNGQ